MTRDPLPGELAARIDDLDDQVRSLRNAVLAFIALGTVLWLDLRERKAVKNVD